MSFNDMALNLKLNLIPLKMKLLYEARLWEILSVILSLNDLPFKGKNNLMIGT
jgi:hypothetical protein